MSELDLEGISAARRYALWYLGDPSWANQIIDAYNNPDATNAMIDRERDEP